jgi:hypothetical protein
LVVSTFLKSRKTQKLTKYFPYNFFSYLVVKDRTNASIKALSFQIKFKQVWIRNLKLRDWDSVYNQNDLCTSTYF